MFRFVYRSGLSFKFLSRAPLFEAELTQNHLNKLRTNPFLKTHHIKLHPFGILSPIVRSASTVPDQAPSSKKDPLPSDGPKKEILVIYDISDKTRTPLDENEIENEGKPKRDQENHQNYSEITEEPVVIPKVAKVIGTLGLIPFVSTAIVVTLAVPDIASQALFYQLTYASAILSFMGGPHFGLAVAEKTWDQDGVLTKTQQNLRFWLSTLPPLVAWSLTSLHPFQAVTGMLLSYTLLFAGDAWATSHGLLPKWYMKLRIPLTVIVLLSLGASFIRIQN